MHSGHIQQVLEYRALAKQYLQAEVWQYLAQGESHETESVFAKTKILPRVLVDTKGGNTHLKLFGKTLEHPILLAPIAYQSLFHAEGEVASALAASAQGGQMVVSSLASQYFEKIAYAFDAEKNRAPWFQLYWQGHRDHTLKLLERAVNAGFEAIVMTVDAPIKQSTLALPSHVSAVNLEKQKSAQNAHSVFNHWMKQAPIWDDVAWLRSQTPLLIKGILHPDDAEKALDLGCDGIIVSKHGNRVLPGVVSSIEMLPLVVQRVKQKIPILFDSGIYSGRDIFIALAYGASAVLVGRSYIWGLAVNGAMGVAHVLRLLRDELEMVMALTGCRQLQDIHLNYLIQIHSKEI